MIKSIFRLLPRLLAHGLWLVSASAIQVSGDPLSLQECIDLAFAQNPQYLNEYQVLARTQAQLLQARAPFALQVEADFNVPTYREFRDVQENVALQTRIREETTDFTYTGRLQLTQQVPSMGRFSLVSSAQRRDFSSTFREDVLDFVGDMQLSYAHELMHTPREEISLKQAELGMTSAQFSYERQRRLLEGRVIDAYYTLVQSIRQLEIEEQRLNQSRASLELAQRKFEIGLIAEVEALRLRVFMLRAEASYAQAETQIERRRDQLREVLGMDMDASLDVVTEVEFRQQPIDPDHALEVGLRQRTDMQQEEITEEIRLLGLKDIKRRNGVTAALNANLSLLGRGKEIGDISRNLARNQWGVGIEVNLPLLDNGLRQSTIRQAEVSLEQSRLSKDARRREIIREIRDAVRNLRETERQISLRQAALEVAERTYEVEQSRFELGLAQSQDLIDAQAELTQARIDVLNEIINYQRQLKDLRLATMADLDQLATVSAE